MEWKKNISPELEPAVHTKISQLLDVLKKEDTDIFGLMRGKAGLALGLIYYAGIHNDEEVFDYGLRHIDAVYDHLESGECISSYSSGLAGIGWVLHHLTETRWLSLPPDIFDVIGRQLEKDVLIDLERNCIDFLHGYLGIAYYFLCCYKKDNRRHREILTRIIDRLSASAVATGNGAVKWYYINPQAPGGNPQAPGGNPQAPGGNPQAPGGSDLVNIGLSHGMANIIVFLSKLADAGFPHPRVLPLLQGAIQYLDSIKLDPDSYDATFPSSVIESQTERKNSRLAWCYGDVGIAFSLWRAGWTLQRPELRTDAVKILKRTFPRRGARETGAGDPSFCHGSTGIAHMYNRMHRETGIDEFKRNALDWLDISLNMAQFKDGLAGFKSYYKAYGWIKEIGFLEGVTGIFLTYLSFVTDTEPCWDQALFLS